MSVPKFAWPLRAVMIAVLLAPAAVAHAQQPSTAAVANAREIITLKGAAGVYEVIVPGVVEQVKNLFLQRNPNLAKDLSEVAAKLRQDYAPRRSEVLEEVAKLYASRFTEQELRDAVAFYKTPLGKKLIEEEPKVLDQSMQVAQNWGDRLSEQVIAGMRNEMKKRGHDL
jgi:hypothetical protein